MSYLVLVRHGESRWNLDNRFTGWVDVALSEKGIKEAIKCSKELENISFDLAYTSKLERAQETLLIILVKQNKTGIFLHENKKEKKWSLHPIEFMKNEIPIYSSIALNERYYGCLQGMNKETARQKFGEKKVFEWRRSYDIAPPKGECLKDVYNRTVPYYKKEILPKLKDGKNIIVSAHGNSLRALIKFLDDITDEQIPFLELSTGKPIVYKYTNRKVIKQNIKFNLKRPTKWK
ncbi:MAG: 2,3-bisphosphoglycerate-dependent phosphoglycerate mutase [Candidatus ainarchaeum sp.]|nr:2,3-bisphosphoglycerate-dependent phosphoglycerate mutase [Candidatus ainarchaeum sp.]